MDALEKTLQERGSRYGDFSTHASIAQGLKTVMQNAPKWSALQPDQKEALEMVAHKIGRILNGDPDYADSWHDIAGYVALVEKRLAAKCFEAKENPCSADEKKELAFSSHDFDFFVQENGVFFAKRGASKRAFLCSRIDVAAKTHDGMGRNWGRLLTWKGGDGEECATVFRMEEAHVGPDGRWLYELKNSRLHGASFAVFSGVSTVFHDYIVCAPCKTIVFADER